MWKLLDLKTRKHAASKDQKKNEEDVAKTREKGINKELLERYLEEF